MAKGAEKMLPPSDKMISGAKDLVCSKMTKTKDAISSGMASVVDTAKGVVQGGLGMTRSTLTGTKDAVASGVTGAVGVAKGAVQTGMDTTKTVLTGTKDAVSTGLTGAVGVAKGAVQTGLNTTQNAATDTRDTVYSGMTNAVNVAQVAAQGGLDTWKAVSVDSKDAVTSGLRRAGDVAQGAVQTGLSTIQHWLPGSQDATSRRLASSRTSDEGGEQTIQSPHEAQSCWVSTSPHSLCEGLDLKGKATASTEDLVSAVMTFTQEAVPGKEDVGHGATTHGHEGAQSFVTLRNELEELGEIFQPMSAEEQARLAVSQPRPRVLTADQGSYFVRLGDLAPGFRQRAFEHALSQLQHGQFQARAVLAQLEDAFVKVVPDAGALSKACGLIQQLHVAYSALASGLQGLPAELQQQVGQARRSLCELYSVVSSADCGAELPAERLAQSRRAVVQAWQRLERLLEGVQHSPPLSWLVGPFALQPEGQQL
nr:perilipin-4 [Vicugna pacos]